MISQENQGSSDDLSNLKALCFSRNAGKRDGCLPTQEGSTDFRSLQTSYAHRQDSCVFCALEASGRVLLENELALCIADAYPVTPGHSLVIPRRHGSDGLALHQPEWNAVVELLKQRREQLHAQDATISGWAGLLNARGGLNSGEAAGQSVFHAHWHLIPRRTGDDKCPRGGARGGYQAQSALLSGGLPFGRADEGDWGGTATPEARLAAATARPSQKESQQGLLPGGPPKTTQLHTLRGDREACRTRTCEGHC